MKRILLYTISVINIILAVYIYFIEVKYSDQDSLTLSRAEKLDLLDSLANTIYEQNLSLAPESKYYEVSSAEYFYTLREMTTLKPNENQNKYYFNNEWGVISKFNNIYIYDHYLYARDIYGLEYDYYPNGRRVYKGILLFSFKDSLKILGNVIGTYAN